MTYFTNVEPTGTNQPKTNISNLEYYSNDGTIDRIFFTWRHEFFLKKLIDVTLYRNETGRYQMTPPYPNATALRQELEIKEWWEKSMSPLV